MMAGRDKKIIKTLQLTRGEDRDSKLFKCPLGSTLRLTLARNISSSPVIVETDYPSEGSLYVRGKMRGLEWTYTSKREEWDPDRFVDILLTVPGPFKLEWKLSSQPPSSPPSPGHGFFLVEPDLGLSPNSICCLTHITKLLGPLTEWRGRLSPAHQAGYNMLHFTPPQQLGSSRSGYSIANQLKLDSSYLPSGYQRQEVGVVYKNREGEEKTVMLDSAFLEMEQELKHLREDCGVLSIVDVVWNHTSFDTPWLIQHPEACYNLVNSPHLRPAYALDSILYQFSVDISRGDWAWAGLQPTIQSEHDLNILRNCLLDNVLPRAKLWEYYCVDIEAVVKEFRQSVYRMNGGEHPRPEGKSLRICQDPQYRRLGSTVDASLTLELFNVYCDGAVCFEERIEKCISNLRYELQQLNGEMEDHIKHLLHAAVNNITADVRYQFLEGHGPRRTTISPAVPFTQRYFVHVGGSSDLSGAEIEGSKGRNVVAHNGWVMNADPLVNFAEEGSEVYFKRELIVWADSVKLRYGSKPSDSPWLWSHMTQYTQSMALLFDGLRLDNCHNTPLVVAEGLLDAAREVKPNLYLVAELFTPSEERDNYFVNRLGINCLIREAMSANISRELGRLVYKYGGDPVASFFSSSVLKSSVANSMFFDVTHDNDPGHILSRSVFDALPNSALVAIASCASGSCRGYDELVPHKIDVVFEKRLYTSWSDTKSGPAHSSPDHAHSTIDLSTGIMEAKKILNTLHKELSDGGYNEIYVDQVTEEIVAVTRHCPAHHKSYILMAHTAFRRPPDWATPTSTRPHTGHSDVPPLTIQGTIKEIYVEARLVQEEGVSVGVASSYYINGISNQYRLDMRRHINMSESLMCKLVTVSEDIHEVIFTDFCPGSIIIYEVELLPQACNSVDVLRSFLGREKTNSEGCDLWSGFASKSSSLSLIDVNYLLYRCDVEERADGKGGGVYDVPDIGSMTYCGLQGIINMIKPIRDSNDLGHPLCDNLRSGNWLLGYTAERLKLCPSTREIGEIISGVFHHLSVLPRYLLPCYFDGVVTLMYEEIISSSLPKMSKFISNGSSFIKDLALGSIQLCGDTPSAVYPRHEATPTDTPMGSMAAGLPHFATGFMRCWGRDTFISLRGLLLVTGRYEEARNTILSFGSCLRHGLIPNLLNGGNAPRYNCRDATWWWLQSIQDYMKMAPDGNSLLQASLRKLFASDESAVDFVGGVTVTLAEVIQDSLQRHASGISFTERGAGPGLDRDMTPPGFIVSVSVDWEETGFIRGGNQFNCGTWMDKVGESSWAGNKGVPATPRDGSAVELVGLSYSAIKWLSDLYDVGLYPFSGVYTTHSKTPGSPFITFKKWATQIKDSFESKFWIPLDEHEAAVKEGENSHYIHRLGIYKDTCGSSHKYTDYQLRPNFPVAMVVAPDLFTPSNACIALEKTEELLLGPLGMKTLDPGDWQYNGYYLNSIDSNNYKTAKGFNYHQGPEWLWVIGYFLRAKLLFCEKPNEEDVTSYIYQTLSNHAQSLQESPWSGLPELTNQNGADCPDSCPIQAWSMATLLDTLYDVAERGGGRGRVVS